MPAIPEGAEPVTEEKDEFAEEQPNKGSNLKERQYTENEEEVVIYDSVERGTCYNCFRWFWCGCTEPTHHITTKYVKEIAWKGCTKKSSSMAMENITDVQRRQAFCCALFSGLPCCPCFMDMGDIVLFGHDQSERLASGEVAEWVLDNVQHSFDIFEKLTGHLQKHHQGWRKTGKSIGRKIGQV